ncbi:molybdopterin-binding oxidoreductase [Aeromonas bivalvium]|uniref:Molybdopterin-binding oxidoreductase n=1 Tax=Aeromonas bivalvium TaxID=440079 RepID=A0ABW9GVN2_9GAMM
MMKLAVFALLTGLMNPAMAMEAPKGPVILTVTGNVNAEHGQEGRVALDLALIQSLPQHEIVTSNPWVDKPHHYKGPKVADLLAALNARGKTLTLTALNSFQIKVDWERVQKYEPILAWQDDGITMRVRDKGPLWFILPLDQYPELKQSAFTDMMIWQLSAIDIQN